MPNTFPNPSVPHIEDQSTQCSFILDSLPALVFYIDKDLCFTYINKSFEKWFGLPKEQVTGKQMKDILEADSFLRLKEFADKALTGVNIDFQTEVQSRTGTIQLLEGSFKPDFAGTGQVKGIVAFIKEPIIRTFSHPDIPQNPPVAKDSGDEKVLDALQQANQQLLRYNEELEQFAYAASHDLQEPLRKIQTFAGMLVERNYDELNEAGKNYLSKIQKSTERMSGIINDLLAYSRQSRIDEMFEETDLNIIIENVVSDLELMIQQKGAQVICDMLPNIKAIPSQMNRLFYNLINNSLKFSNPDLPPRIHIYVQQHLPDDYGKETSFIEFIIKDNGIGFEQKYADRIFQLFQRLNDKHSYDGNGIGLSLCKKIVQNHFGEISAEAHPNEGAIFHLKFPINILAEAKALAV